MSRRRCYCSNACRARYLRQLRTVWTSEERGCRSGWTAGKVALGVCPGCLVAVRPMTLVTRIVPSWAARTVGYMPRPAGWPDFATCSAVECLPEVVR